jgi:putative tricarboxylic transport membrane protein
MKIKNEKDFWSGLIFIAFGLFFFLTARNYEMGTARRMGPGYFPTILGGLIVVLGSIVFLRSLVLKGGNVPSISLRPLFFITISLIIFGYLFRPLGMVPVLALLVFVSAFVGHEFKFKEVLFLSIALIILSVLVFNLGLGLPLPIWPGFAG